MRKKNWRESIPTPDVITVILSCFGVLSFRAILSKYYSPTYPFEPPILMERFPLSLSLSQRSLLKQTLSLSLSLSLFPTKTKTSTPIFLFWVLSTLPQNLAFPTQQSSHLNFTFPFSLWTHNQVPFYKLLHFIVSLTPKVSPIFFIKKNPKVHAFFLILFYCTFISSNLIIFKEIGFHLIPHYLTFINYLYIIAEFKFSSSFMELGYRFISRTVHIKISM